VKDPNEPFHFTGSDIDGNVLTNRDARFQGRVVLLTVGGTWCPNCHDEAPFLVDLYKDFHDKGLEVVGLFFESDPALAAARPRVQSFIRRYGVEFPILVAGTNRGNDAVQKLSQLVNFAVYPTTIVLGRDGRVRQVHAGFASAATGDEHLRLIQEERDLIARLLAESAPGSQAADNAR
jgi:thiol-disulfide isomerase/thioredoxin